jgi:acyl-coenzyme A synthetase/AMP-(fatty) acid ligase
MWQRFFTGRGFYLGLMFQQAAARHPDVPVFLDRPLDVAGDDQCRYTYRDLARLVDDLAARLWTVGVRPADHVAIHKTDNVDIALLACAVSRIGAVPAMLSPALGGVVVAGLLARLQRPWLVTDDAKLSGPLAEVGVRELARRVLTVGPATAEAPPGVTNLTGLAGGATRRPPVRLSPRDPVLVTHSSGTTGVPKLAVHCAQTMWHRLVPQKMLGWPTRGETAALHMSFVHSRFYHALGVFLHYGSPLVLLVDPDPKSVGPMLTRTRPGILETHPNTYVLWEDLADAPGAPLASVRCFGSTFDAIHPRTLRRLLGASKRRSPWLTQLYGQSETGPVAAWWYTRRSATKVNSRLVGIGLPGFTRVRVVDPDGNRVKAGTPGHIEARTWGRCLTYLGGEQLYERQLDAGWWRMGDVGYLNRWGALHLIDREVDQIDTVASGLKVEDVLMSRLDELREVIVVPDGSGHAVPVVCTRDDEPIAPDRWKRATEDLPPLTGPMQWRFEDLPRTSTWKIKKLELARMIAAGDVPAVRYGG